MANPLTLVLAIEDGKLPALLQALAGSGTTIDQALAKLGTVHFARNVLIDISSPNLQPTAGSAGPFFLMVITEYDNSFDLYIQQFVEQIGPVFDLILPFVVGGADVVPVEQNLVGFQQFIAQNDLSQQQLPGGQMNGALYSAYPQTVQQILQKFPPPPAS
jgi:hypothetical protein